MTGKLKMPLRVVVWSRLFRRCYPLYRLGYFLYKRCSDRRQLALLRERLEAGRKGGQARPLVIFDIGANIGFYTRFFARRAGADAEIHAFEPAPDNLRRLAGETAGFPNVVTHPEAVSDRSGELALALSPDSTVDHHVGGGVDSESAKISVPCAELDSLFASLPRVDLIKMDIQGAEIAALRGMRRLLARSPGVLILMELWPWGLKRAGGDWRELMETLSGMGLAAWSLDETDLADFCLGARDDPGKHLDIAIEFDKAAACSPA